METVEDQPVPKIAEATGACLDSFNRCLEQSDQFDQRQRSSIEDQLGRFSIWASNIGAFAPRRASLDHRLRMAPDVQRLVRGLLQTLNDHLQDYLLQTPPSTEDEDVLTRGLGPISKDITLLHRLSNTIRKASSESQNLRAATNFKITDEEGNDVGSIFRDLFASELIRRKFPACSETLRERLASAMLLRRKRILYRRSRHGRLVGKHEAPKASPPEHAESEETEDVGAKQLPPSEAKSVQSVAGSRATTTATTVNPEQFMRVSSTSVVARAATLRLSTQEETFFPPAPKASILQRFKALKEDREASHKAHLSSLQHYDMYIENNGNLPLEPAELNKLKESISDAEHDFNEGIENDRKLCYEGNYEVVCPYCCCILLSADVMDDHKWRNHIKHDMDA